MTTLGFDTPGRKLARILHAASVVGPGAWAQPGDSSGHRESTESTLADDLAALFRMLTERRVSYLLVGGVAMLRYIDGRNTDDMDFILVVDDVQRLPEIDSRTPESARGRFRGVRVDLLFTSNEVFRLALDRHATTHTFAGIDVACSTVDGLVLLKLYALPSLRRQGDLQRAALYETDVLMLRQRHATDLPRLLETLQPHAGPGGFEDLRPIIDDMDQRLARMASRRA